MRVGVDEPRQQRRRAEIDQAGAGRQGLGVRRAHLGDAVAANHDFYIVPGLVGHAVDERLGANDDRFCIGGTRSGTVRFLADTYAGKSAQCQGKEYNSQHSVTYNSVSVVSRQSHQNNTRGVPLTEETPTKQPTMPPGSAGVNDLFAALYADLHAMAHKQLQRAKGPLLDTTALVHEAYVRFADSEQVPAADRRHFLAYAAHVMRSVVVDIIRSENAEKRGSGALSVTLNTDVRDAVPSTEGEVLKIHEALVELSLIDTVLVQIVEMRYFAGLTEEEIADATQLSERTVRRHWQKARIFLRESLTQD